MTWLEDTSGNKCSVEGSVQGFSLEPFHRNISREELFQNLADMWTKLGRQPKFRDCYPGLSRYSASTYADRFGGWRNALIAFVEWGRGNGFSVKSEIPEPRLHRTTRHINLRLRAEILMRDFSTCQLCGAQPKDGVRLEVDHIVGWANGGETVSENLQTLCSPCNNGKSDSEFYENNSEYGE